MLIGVDYTEAGGNFRGIENILYGVGGVGESGGGKMDIRVFKQ